MKKATIKPATAEQILRAHGISKKREAAVLARYAAALKKRASKVSTKAPRRTAEVEAVTT